MFEIFKGKYKPHHKITDTLILLYLLLIFSYYDPKFGNCIRFNSGINKDGFLWDVHGIDDELVLVIFLGPPIDSHNLFDSLTSGLAVSVNDQNSPMLKMNWIAITPGTLGRIVNLQSNCL
jgi:hypothetical protein